MKIMKTIKNFCSSNERQLIEIAIPTVVVVVPLLNNLPSVFKGYLAETQLSPDNFFIYLAVKKGSCVASLILLLIAWYYIRKANSDDEFIMNQQYVYHNYPYWWYCFCAKILNIEKCNLILVPIFMQFKLVIRSTFKEYPLNEEDYPTITEQESDFKVTVCNADMQKDEINIILEDTYTISKRQLPSRKQSLRTIKISRNDGIDVGRHFSQAYIDTVINQIRKLGQNITVNVFSTTNPLNTMHIARRAFGLGNRGNINHLYVFQQSNEGDRLFEKEGHKIY